MELRRKGKIKEDSQKLGLTGRTCFLYTRVHLDGWFYISNTYSVFRLRRKIDDRMHAHAYADMSR
jgi:hypothetical protein